MKITTTHSTTPQPAKIIGPTVTLYHTDERIINDEGGTTYEYTEYRFQRGEVELIQVGSLPAGAVWDDVLRGIERSALYDTADIKISAYSTDKYDEDKRQAWIAYKAAVRATPNQPNYPAEVEYPIPPE